MLDQKTKLLKYFSVGGQILYVVRMSPVLQKDILNRWWQMGKYTCKNARNCTLLPHPCSFPLPPPEKMSADPPRWIR